MSKWFIKELKAQLKEVVRLSGLIAGNLAKVTVND